MRLLGYATILLAVSYTAHSYAHTTQCGSPPIVQNTKLKAELDGKAQFLSSIIGDSAISGKFEQTADDVLSKYPDADSLRINTYLLYITCISIFDDRNMSGSQKVDQFIKARGAATK